jgi:hypothetical protein
MLWTQAEHLDGVHGNRSLNIVHSKWEQFFLNIFSTKLHEHSSSGSLVVSYVQTETLNELNMRSERIVNAGIA